MLARAAGRSLRLRSIPSPNQIALNRQRLQNYAKSSKPKKAVEYKPPSAPAPINRHGPIVQQLQRDPKLVGPSTVSGVSKANDENPISDTSKETVGLAKDERAKDGSAMRLDHDETEPILPSITLGSSPQAQSSPSLENEKVEPIEPFTPVHINVAQEISTSDTSGRVKTPKNEGPMPPPLHDLTKGIPSTLDAELSDTSSISPQPTSLNVTEDPTQPSTGGRGDRELPASAYISSSERRRNRMANWMYASILLSSITGTVWLGRDWESQEEELKHPNTPSGWGLSLFYNRAKARLADTLDYYNEPAFPKLLPNTDPAWERPYTLVLSLEDLLVHSEWTRDHGWRMAKRPGVDYFLRYLSQYYELVIFTSVPSMIADPVIQKLDPYRIVMWPLFREATRYKGGQYIKVSIMPHTSQYSANRLVRISHISIAT